MSKIKKKDIVYLFDELWPLMPYATEHKTKCLEQFESIQAFFKKYKPKNHDKLFRDLKALPGIGITIASGLIWSGYEDRRVPFDRYTTSYALKLGIIRSNNILDNYLDYCSNIQSYCEEQDYDIEDFVREAMLEMKDSIWITEPE